MGFIGLVRRNRQWSVFVGIFIYFTLMFGYVCAPVESVAVGKVVGQWQVDEYGVRIQVRLVAPPSVETMRYYWFNASAEIMAIDSGPPHYVETVFFYNLSHRLVEGGAWSFGTNSYGENVTVGFTIRHSNREIISAASANIGPGQHTLLTYYVGVEFGVETEGGTLQRVDRAFAYEFVVIAGDDAVEHLQRIQQQLIMISGIGTLILIVVIGGAAYFSQRKK